MTHDPLCLMTEPCGELDSRHTSDGGCQDCGRVCVCALMAKVRADERNRIFTHLDALADRDHTEGCPSLTCTGCAESSAEGVQIVQ